MSEPARMADPAPDDLPLPRMHEPTQGDPVNADRDQSEQPAGVRCARCGETALGFATINGDRYCHADERSCYTEQCRDNPTYDRLRRGIEARRAARRLADAVATQSAPEPSQAAPVAPSIEARVRRYAEAILRESVNVQKWDHPKDADAAFNAIRASGGVYSSFERHARAALAVADAEQETLRAKVARVEALAGRWRAATTWDDKAARVDRAFGEALRAALDAE